MTLLLLLGLEGFKPESCNLVQNKQTPLSANNHDLITMWKQPGTLSLRNDKTSNVKMSMLCIINETFQKY